MRPAHGDLDGITSRQRVRRLFAVLDDVGYYAAGFASTRMLATAWDRISELLLQADDLAMRAAVADVDRQDVGSAAWWLAIRRVSRAFDDRHLPLYCGPQLRHGPAARRDQPGRERPELHRL